MDALGQSALMVALTSFALSFSVLARNARNKVFIAFGMLTALISIWALGFFLERVFGGGAFYRLHLFAHVWLAPAALVFVRVMLSVDGTASRRLLDLSVACSIALTVALLFGLEAWGWVGFAVNSAPIFILLQTLQLMWFDRRLRLGLRKITKRPLVGFTRRSWIYIGAILTVCTSTMDHAPWLGSGIPALGNLLLAVYLYFISQAISQQRLLNFSALISRFVVVTALAVTLAAFYSLLVAWIEDSPGLFFLNSAIASFAILMVLDPLRKVVGSLTMRLLTQQNRQLEKVLREAQLRVTGIVDQGALYQEILTVVEQAIQPLGAAIYVLRRDATRFRRVRAVGSDLMETDPTRPASPKEIIVHHPLVNYCSYLRKKGELPILLDQIIENEIERSASRTQREILEAMMQGLRALHCNMMIPIFADDEILGFVTLHSPSPPDQWGSNWGLLPIVFPFFDLVGQSLRNMEVFVRAREKERLAALGEMSAGLAHEIRNPLGAIKGAAQELEAEGGTPDPKMLRVIVDEANRLNRVVTQFLEYSKPNPSQESMVRVDLNRVVERAVEALKPGLPDHVSLDVEYDPRKALVKAQPEQIQQVILNLVRNSVKALESVSDTRRKRVRLWVEHQGGEIHTVVEDNGSGISRENMDKLFIPFFTTSTSGTGLGLSICQKIIEAHRGRIDVSSDPGKLTRFTVVLPLADEAKGAEKKK